MSVKIKATGELKLNESPDIKCKYVPAGILYALGGLHKPCTCISIPREASLTKQAELIHVSHMLPV